MLLALLVLHLCKVSCLCRCIVQRLGSADISVLAYNFWQATKASLLLGRQSPYFPPARMPGVYAKRLYARTHTSGRTKSVQDAPTTNDHDRRDAKPSECPKGDRDNKSEVNFKNRLFLSYKLKLQN